MTLRHQFGRLNQLDVFHQECVDEVAQGDPACRGACGEKDENLGVEMDRRRHHSEPVKLTAFGFREIVFVLRCVRSMPTAQSSRWKPATLERGWRSACELVASIEIRTIPHCGSRHSDSHFGGSFWYSWVVSNHRPPDPQFHCLHVSGIPHVSRMRDLSLINGHFVHTVIPGDAADFPFGGSAVVPGRRA
jgi:hypothetical protein